MNKEFFGYFQPQEIEKALGKQSTVIMFEQIMYPEIQRLVARKLIQNALKETRKPDFGSAYVVFNRMIPVTGHVGFFVPASLRIGGFNPITTKDLFMINVYLIKAVNDVSEIRMIPYLLDDLSSLTAEHQEHWRRFFPDTERKFTWHE